MLKAFFPWNFAFFSALAILEPQIHVVVEQFEGKIYRCSAGVLLLFENEKVFQSNHPNQICGK